MDVNGPFGNLKSAGVFEVGQDAKSVCIRVRSRHSVEPKGAERLSAAGETRVWPPVASWVKLRDLAVVLSISLSSVQSQPFNLSGVSFLEEPPFWFLRGNQKERFVGGRPKQTPPFWPFPCWSAFGFSVPKNPSLSSRSLRGEIWSPKGSFHKLHKVLPRLCASWAKQQAWPIHSCE